MTNPWDNDGKLDGVRFDDKTPPSKDQVEAMLRDIAEKVGDKIRAERRRRLWRAIWASTFTVASIPFVMLWQGYVLSTLWAWFAQPVFGIRMSIYFATGLALLARTVLPEDNTKRHPLATVATPLMALGLGALWHWLGWGL